MHQLPIEVLCYGLVSAVALAIDMLVLKTLVEIAAWHYLPASAVAFLIGAAIAYVLSIRFVFQFRRMTNRALEFGYFVALGLVGVVVNAVVLFAAISGAGLALIPAKLIAAVCTFTANFALRRALLFSPSGIPQ